MYDSGSDAPKASLSNPGVAVFRAPTAPEAPPPSTETHPVLEMSIWTVHAADDELLSVVIYRNEEPITRLEVLSPANKPGGSHHTTYLTKRDEGLHAGLKLVEIDYLHQVRPLDPRVPSYPDHHPHALPYHIAVSDPDPTLREGRTQIYGTGVVEPLPAINIPLRNQDRVQVNIGMIYNRIFEATRRYGEILVDYSQVPVNFEAYTEADQAAIRAHMTQIAANRSSNI